MRSSLLQANRIVKQNAELKRAEAKRNECWKQKQQADGKRSKARAQSRQAAGKQASRLAVSKAKRSSDNRNDCLGSELEASG